MIPNKELGTIDTYRIPLSSTIASLDADQIAPTVTLIGSFLLPELAEKRSFIEIDIQSSPNPIQNHPLKGTSPNIPPEAVWVLPPGVPAPPERSFITDPAKAIVAITTAVQDGPNEEHADNGRLFVHRDHLLQVLTAAQEKHDAKINQSEAQPESSNEQPILIPWKQWGPDWSRWLSIPQPNLVVGPPGSNLRKGCVYGQRYVQLLPPEARSSDILDPNDKVEGKLVKLVAYMYDFNRWTPKIMLQNEKAMKEKENIALLGGKGALSLTHTGIQLGYNYKTKGQMPYDVVLSGDPDPPSNKLQAEGDQIVFVQDKDGVAGKVGYVRYSLPGFSNVDDIWVDARMILQREVRTKNPYEKNTDKLKILAQGLYGSFNVGPLFWLES